MNADKFSFPNNASVMEEVILLFEQAWQRGENPNPAAFVAPGADSRLIAELVHIDMERRLKQGESVRVEDYLERFRVLDWAKEGAEVVDLLVAEFRHRQGAEPELSADEYQRRFPQYFQQFLEHLAASPARAPGGMNEIAAQALESRVRPQVPEIASGLRETLSSGTLPQGEASVASTALGPELPNVPGYEILEELGRGGMGVVYKARHFALKRLVALKMILSGFHAGKQELARFRTEAEAIAQLQHPHIIQIYEIGELNGLPYLSLEYADGGSLATALKGNPQDCKESARLVETLARATAAAHQRGIVHRDLKPANVLLARLDESKKVNDEASTKDKRASTVHHSSFLMHHAPKISDFGLAKRLGDDSAQTQSGAVMGTPIYMAPEQATGNSKNIGPATDIYALGVILYELLTGRPPFRGATIHETMQQIQQQEPVSPRLLQPRVPRDLDTICLQCLRKEPCQRFGSALELAEDLQRFLAGEPIRARPVPAWERAWKWVQRRPAAAGLIGALVITMLAMAAVTVTSFYNARLQRERDEAHQQRQRAEAQEVRAGQEQARAEQQRADAERQKTRAEEQEALARHYRYVAQLSLAGRMWREGNVGQVSELLSEQLPRGKQEDHRHFEWHYLWNICQRHLASFEGHDGSVNCVAASADGRLMASGSQDKTVKVWDLSKEEEVLTFSRHSGPVYCVNFSPDGKWIASAGEDKSILIWDLQSGRVHLTLAGHSGAVRDLAFSKDGKWLASASTDKTLIIWDAASGKVARTFRGHEDSVNTTAFSPDGKWLASAGSDEAVKLWNVAEGTEAFNLIGHVNAVFGVSFSPDGSLLASGGLDATVRLWDVHKGKPVATYTRHKGPVSNVAFSPDGKLLGSSSWDRSARIWNLPKRQAATDTEVRDGVPIGLVARKWIAPPNEEAAVLGGHSGWINCLTFLKENRFVTASQDGTLKVWDPVSASRVRDHRVVHKSAASSVAFSPDGKWLWSGNTKGGITISNVSELSENWRHDARLPAFHADSVLAGNDDGDVAGRSVRLVHFLEPVLPSSPDTPAAKPAPKPAPRPAPRPRFRPTPGSPGYRPPSTGLPYNAQSTRLARPWSGTPRPTPLRNPLFQPDASVRVQCIAFNLLTSQLLIAQGQKAHVSAMNDGTFGRKLGSLATDSTIGQALFSPNGKGIIIADHQKTFALWDQKYRKKTRIFAGHAAPVNCVALSGNGAWLASGGDDDAVILWDFATGKMGHRLEGHIGPVKAVQFAPDSETLASCGLDGNVILWDRETGERLLTLRGHTDSVLSLAFSPDGNRVASGSADKSVKIWEVFTGQEVISLAGHEGEISALAFSPDGRLLASASADRTVRLWNAGEVRTEDRPPKR